MQKRAITWPHDESDINLVQLVRSLQSDYCKRSNDSTVLITLHPSEMQSAKMSMLLARIHGITRFFFTSSQINETQLKISNQIKIVKSPT